VSVVSSILSRRAVRAARSSSVRGVGRARACCWKGGLDSDAAEVPSDQSRITDARPLRPWLFVNDIGEQCLRALLIWFSR
jgi:hypothetical protein